MEITITSSIISKNHLILFFFILTVRALTKLFLEKVLLGYFFCEQALQGNTGGRGNFST